MNRGLWWSVLLATLSLSAGIAAADQLADCNRDGNTDIFWNEAPSGDPGLRSNMKVWYMQGRTCLGEVPTNPSSPGDPNWKLGGVADFDQDGWVDYLFRNLTSGSMVVWRTICPTKIEDGGHPLAGEPDLAWRIVSLADMGSLVAGVPTPAADGHVDILWQHADGRLRIWYMDGYARVGSVPTVPEQPSYQALWKVMGTGDFGSTAADPSPDGHPDILFQHVNSRETVVWYMQGNQASGGDFTVPSAPSPLNWSVVGVGDFGAGNIEPGRDGNADILWRNDDSGRTVIWFMKGRVKYEGAFTSCWEPSFDWRVAAPR